LPFTESMKKSSNLHNINNQIDNKKTKTSIKSIQEIENEHLNQRGIMEIEASTTLDNELLNEYNHHFEDNRDMNKMQIDDDNNILPEDSNKDLDENFENENDITDAVNQENGDNEHQIHNELENTSNTNIPSKDKKSKCSLTRLPLAKIKNIIKLDENVKLCQKNVYEMIGCITEHFLKELSKNSQRVTQINKRKTLNLEDICNYHLLTCFSMCSEEY